MAQEYQPCGVIFKQIGGALLKNANNNLKKDNLTHSQMCLLLKLEKSNDREMTFKQIEKEFHIAQATVAGIISRLAQKGFVQTFVSPFDKRVKMVRITQSGLQQCEKAKDRIENAEQFLVSRLSEDERKELFRLLTIVNETLHSDPEEKDD
ncbi:MAG: MarR family transcriptional regulator [Clostridia bacterium]|nr:MarR family transcriptional regulator [Clostridia bacterium]